MAQAQKLSIIAIDNHYQPFGNTDYVTVFAETANKETIPVAISHNSLRKVGITESVFDNLIDCTIIVKDDTNVRTGEITDAEFRIQQVVNKMPNRTILLCNGANSMIVKSEVLISEMKEINTTVQAKVAVEKDKNRKLENAKRKAERVSEMLRDAKTEILKESSQEPANLGDNEDLGF